jgi:phytoene dehydrogenase-like protein
MTVVPNKTVAKRVYDVAILGPDVGGAVTAALAARLGMRTLLVPLAQVSAARESEGWLLPSAHPMIPPLRQLSAAVGTLDELGIASDLSRQAAATQGAFQILSDKLRLSLPAELPRRKAELRRELSDVSAAQAEAALEGLERLGRPWDAFLLEPPPWPPRGFFEKRRAHKMAPPPPQLPEGLVGDCLAALAPFAASLVGDSAPEATAREAAALLRAPLRLFGGAAQLAELLRKKAQEAGGDVVLDDAAQLTLERKSTMFLVAGVEVSASCVVLACGAERIGALVQSGGRVERKVAEEAALPVDRKISLAHFVVRAEGLPLALEEAALLLGPPPAPLLISTQPARRVRGETAGERLLTVARISDAGFSDAEGFLKTVRAALEPVLPFFDRHIVHQSADLNPVHGHPLLRPHDDAEPIGLRPLSAAHERVFFASASTYPGFGLEGQILAARAAADQALAVSGRKSVSAT